MDPGIVRSLVPLVGIIMMGLVVLVPIAGLTVRFAIKPITDSFLKLRESSGNVREVAVLEQRVALLEQQIQHLESSVDRIAAGKEFDRQLSSGPKS